VLVPWLALGATLGWNSRWAGHSLGAAQARDAMDAATCAALHRAVARAVARGKADTRRSLPSLIDAPRYAEALVR
jgi:hypothetical protein